MLFFAYRIKQYIEKYQKTNERKKKVMLNFLVLYYLRSDRKKENKYIQPMTKTKRKRYLLYIVQITRNGMSMEDRLIVHQVAPVDETGGFVRCDMGS